MLAKHSFLRFLMEANSVGAKFEQKTADSIQAWLEKNGLSGKWRAKRYQTLEEDSGNRDEDYSDIVVENIKTGDRFFVECKEFERSNVVNMQFDITGDGRLIPVKGKDRTEITENEYAMSLSKLIKSDKSFKNFVEFLNSKNDLLGNVRPLDFWNCDDNCEKSQKVLPALIKKYNKFVRSGQAESDCKAFDTKKLRDSTLNRLVCALAWRLGDKDRTWDICKVNVPNIGKMIVQHYIDSKAEPAKYIQLGDECLFMTSDDNPLGLKNVPVFPSDATGQFSLKFTPRFGTGSVYVTPRSEITSDFESDYSFINKEKWPSV